MNEIISDSIQTTSKREFLGFAACGLWFFSAADSLIAKAAETYSLTTRETHILRGIYEGKTNAEIAAEIFVAETTVKTHINNLMKKLPVAGRAEIREWLLKSGTTGGN